MIPVRPPLPVGAARLAAFAAVRTLLHKAGRRRAGQPQSQAELCQQSYPDPDKQDAAKSGFQCGGAVPDHVDHTSPDGRNNMRELVRCFFYSAAQSFPESSGKTRAKSRVQVFRLG